MAKVFVGMSGGVDSSVAAALMVEQGHDVTGVYMKNWSQDMPGLRCPWAEDVADAKRVAVSLGIDFKVFDFENEYKQRVVDAMVDEYRLGRTPNPDVMCNQEVKFKLFLEAALEHGAEMIATGHYARVEHRVEAASGSSEKNLGSFTRDPDYFSELPEQTSAKLLTAQDKEKDQTYFLYRVNSEALAKTLFPLGDYTKSEVRDMARQRNLWTAQKKESMGICFVGQVGIKEFLEQYEELVPGDIIHQETGEVLGRHDSAMLYTIGQRHGLNIGGGLPYYVVGKDMAKNIVYVSQNLNHDKMWRKEISLIDIHWINSAPSSEDHLRVRLRHRGELLKIENIETDRGGVKLQLQKPERAVAIGQSAVIYRGDECLGGGIVSG